VSAVIQIGWVPKEISQKYGISLQTIREYTKAGKAYEMICRAQRMYERGESIEGWKINEETGEIEVEARSENEDREMPTISWVLKEQKKLYENVYLGNDIAQMIKGIMLGIDEESKTGEIVKNIREAVEKLNIGINLKRQLLEGVMKFHKEFGELQDSESVRYSEMNKLELIKEYKILSADIERDLGIRENEKKQVPYNKAKK